jgi:hypothetical protein
VRFVGTPALPNLDWVLTLNTPQFRKFSGTAFVIWGRDENFLEWASGDILFATLNAVVAPRSGCARTSSTSSSGSRARATAAWSRCATSRARSWSTRWRARCSCASSGQYIAASRDSLRDDSRTNAPILLRRPDGSFARPGAVRNGSFRGDALFSWQPNPGTVFFAGYGSTLADPRETRLASLRRTQDGFFVKYSYLWRVGT